MFNFLTGNGFARQGYPVRSLFSIPFTGLDDEGFPSFMVNGKEVTRRNYRDINFQQVDDLDFLKYEGSSEPTYNGSFGNVFTFKNFKLNVFLTYSGGNKLRLDPSFYASYSDLWATPKEYRNRWTTLGDERKTDIPVIARYATTTATPTSVRAMQPTTTLRLVSLMVASSASRKSH